MSSDQYVNPFASRQLLHVDPCAARFNSIFAFFSFPPAAATTSLAAEVIKTRRSLRFVVLLLKKRENLGFSDGVCGSPFLPFGLDACGGAAVTTRFPSFNIRSLFCVSTGAHSRSN